MPDFLPPIVAELRGNIGDFRAKMAEASAVARETGAGTGSAFERAGATIRQHFAQMSQSSSTTGQAMRALGVDGQAAGGMLQTALAGGAVAAGAAIAGLAVKGIGEFVKLTAEIRGFQRVTGESAESASKMVAAFNALGIPVEAADKAMFKLAKTAGDTPDKLNSVGIAIAHNKDGTTSLVGTLFNVAEAYQKTHDPAEKASIVFAAFGRSGAAIIPILARGKQGLKEFFDEAQRRGEVFSQADLDKGKEFTLGMRQVGEATKALEISLGKGLVPVLTELAHGLTTVIDTANQVTAPIGGVGSVVSAAFHSMTAPISSVGDLIHGHFLKGVTEAVPVVGGFVQHLFHIGEGAHHAADKVDEMSGKVAHSVNASTDLSGALAGLDPQFAAIAAGSRHVGDTVQVTGDQVKNLADKMGIDLSKANDQQIAKLQEAAHALTFTTTNAQQLAAATATLTSDITNATEKTAAFKSGLDALVTSATAASNAHLAFNEQILKVADAVTRSGVSLDDNTLKGIENQKMLNNLIDAAVKDSEAVERQTGSRQQAAGVLDQHIAKIKEAAEAAGFNKQQVDALIDSLTASAKDWTATVSVNVDDAINNIHRLSDAAAAARTNEIAALNATGAPTTGASTHSERTALAAGGLIKAAGGYFGSGMVASRPTLLFGEGNPAYNEYGITTDPLYRSRSLGLFAALGKELGKGAPTPPPPITLPASRSRGWDGASSPVTIGSITIEINGYKGDKTQLAAEVREELLRMKRRTGTLGLG